MAKYTVRASKSGYAEIEADSEEEALEKATGDSCQRLSPVYRKR